MSDDRTLGGVDGPEAEARLDRLFAEARARAPRPSDALLARVLAEADAAMPPAPLAASPAPPARRSWLAGLAGGLGGWGAMGGLAASTVLGVVLGAVQPEAVSALAAGVWGEGVGVGLAVDEDPLSLFAD